MRHSTDSAALERFSRGERRGLAEMLSLAERGELPPLAPRSAPLIVGIAGSGGAGKSTLVGALVRHLRQQGQRVAVLANDPQSPVTHGALLGDRIRVPLDPNDDGVFFRSLSTRGASGGISAAVPDCLRCLAAFPPGFDVALVETVGVGQDQVAIRGPVEVLLLLVTPGSGDEIQWEKAGLMEVVDLVAVNKSDLPGADRVRAQLESALSLAPAARPVPVVNIIATTGEGVGTLWQAIVARKQTQRQP